MDGTGLHSTCTVILPNGWDVLADDLVISPSLHSNPTNFSTLTILSS
jgi:hypothetical protein